MPLKGRSTAVRGRLSPSYSPGNAISLFVPKIATVNRSLRLNQIGFVETPPTDEPSQLKQTRTVGQPRGPASDARVLSDYPRGNTKWTDSHKVGMLHPSS
jgi:hypothetical protein